MARRLPSKEDDLRQLANRLRGEKAIVTGSSAGLGAVIAETFAAAGAGVVVTGRDPERGEAVAQRIRTRGGEAMFVGADLLDDLQREALVIRAVEILGGLTVLVNCASHPSSNDVDMVAIPPHAWRAQLEIDVTVPSLLCGLAIPHMLESGRGAIVNISWRASQTATPGRAPYGIAKAGLNALGRSVTAEYGRRGIRCNAVQAGWISDLEGTPDSASTQQREEHRAMQMTRLVTRLDVSLAALFLASSESAAISGAVLPVDGGSTVVRAAVLG